MIKIRQIVKTLSNYGFGPYVCVPCSILKPFINYVIDSSSLDYVKASSEGEAVGIASGMNLSGKIPIVMMQNSGLGNAVNPITSLTNIYKIPMLFIISLRGESGKKDEPQHEIMGKITKDMLDLLRVENCTFSDKEEDLNNLIKKASSYISKTSLPYALILKKGIVDSFDLKAEERKVYTEGSYYKEPGESFDLMERKCAITAIVDSLLGDEPVISTTGMISRELFTVSDKNNYFYMVGSMGCASSVGLGLSMSEISKKIIVLDGDGAVLMKMGTLATIGYYSPANLFHFVLDNESYDSTGGQATVSSSVDIAKVAAVCGYKNAVNIKSEEKLKELILKFYHEPGPHLFNIKVKKGYMKGLGRPDILPVDSKIRFSKAILG